MLVLTRKENQVIHIGDNITVTVVAVEHGRVRIGIEAPANIPVVRLELAPLHSSPQKEQK